MPNRPASREQGFTLVEVLVALVVSALLLGIVMNAALQAKERKVLARQKNEAVLLGETLAAERIVDVFSGQTTQGEEAHLRWIVNETAVAFDPRGLFVLAEIRIQIENGRGIKLFDATTRKLKPAPLS